MKTRFNLHDYNLQLKSKDYEYYEIKKFHGSEKVLYIPEQLMGTPITCISAEAFKDNEETKVIILSNNLKDIAIDAFGSKQIVIYTPYDKNVVNWEFNNSRNVTVRYGFIDIATVNDIDYALFSNNSAIVFNHNLGYRRFENYGRFGESLELETVINEQYKVEGIEDYALYNAINLKKVAFPKQLKWIGNYSFYNNETLESVSLPDGIVEIKDYSFAHCLNLLSFEAPKSLKKMGYHVLSETYRSMIFLESRKQDAKWDTEWNPEKCPIYRGFISFLIDKFINYALLDNATAIIVGNELNALTDLAVPEYIERGDVKYHVTEIGIMAFKNSKYLRSIKIPKTIIRIRDAAFSETNLTEVYLPNSIEHVGNLVFANSIFLKKIHLPEYIPEISEGLCYSCESLEEINIPSSVKIIHNSGFSSCSKLSRIELPFALEILGKLAFYGTSLTYVEIKGNVKRIGDLALGEIDTLTTVVILNKDIMIEDCLITNASNMTIYLEGSEDTDVFLKLIGDEYTGAKIYTDVWKVLEVAGVKYLLNEFDSAIVVSYCEDDLEENVAILSEVAGCEVTHIAKKAFFNAKKIKSITIPDTVVKINEYFLEECTNLRELYLPAHLNQIEASWLNGNRDVTIHMNSVTNKEITPDPVYDKIRAYVIEKQSIDINDIQINFEIGYYKARKIVNQLNSEEDLLSSNRCIK